MKLYEVNNYSFAITPKDVVRVSNSCFWIIRNGEERKCSIFSSYSSHFHTWADAKNHIVRREHDRIERAKRDLADAQERHQKALAIVESE